MKTLLVLRHAKSSWKYPGLPDHERPLNSRGKQDAPRMGRLLREEDLTPELIISSSANRARTTAEIVAMNSGYDSEIEINQDFYFGDPEDFLERLQQLSDELTRVMVVGHNPGMEELVALLTDQYERLPTAALAEIALPIQRWQQLSDETPGRLVNLWHPRGLWLS